MNEDGWYITEAVAPEGTKDAGQMAWVVMLNGVWQQGFVHTSAGLLQARLWGLWNSKGWLSVR